MIRQSLLMFSLAVTGCALTRSAPPIREVVPLHAEDPSMGPPSAPVVLVLFADFQ